MPKYRRIMNPYYAQINHSRQRATQREHNEHNNARPELRQKQYSSSEALTGELTARLLTRQPVRRAARVPSRRAGMLSHCIGPCFHYHFVSPSAREHRGKSDLIYRIPRALPSPRK